MVPKENSPRWPEKMRMPPFAKPPNGLWRGNGIAMEQRYRSTTRDMAAMLLRDLIEERTGMFFSDSNMEIMLDKVSSLMIERGSDSLIDYYYRLKYDQDD